jgi:hypothetical protein
VQNINVLWKNAPMILTILYTTAEIGENKWLNLYGFNPLGIDIAYGSGFGNVLAGVTKGNVIEWTIDGIEECLKGLSKNILDLKNIIILNQIMRE